MDQNESSREGRRARNRELLERITIKPGRCGGRPCIRDSRIRVSDVLDELAGGSSREEIFEDYPTLEPDDITAALYYASLRLNHAHILI